MRTEDNRFSKTLFCKHLSTPQYEQGTTQGQFFLQNLTGLNSEFSFSNLLPYENLRAQSILPFTHSQRENSWIGLPSPFLIARRRIFRCIPKSIKRYMKSQQPHSGFELKSTFCNDNNYTMNAPLKGTVL